MKSRKSRRLECARCGFPVVRIWEECPKCGIRDARMAGSDGVVTVDLAHNGESVHEALEKLEVVADRALSEGRQVLRVIHGYGSAGNHTRRIRGAIRSRLSDLCRRFGGKLESDGNPGVTDWRLSVQGRGKFSSGPR